MATNGTASVSCCFSLLFFALIMIVGFLLMAPTAAAFMSQGDLNMPFHTHVASRTTDVSILSSLPARAISTELYCEISNDSADAPGGGDDALTPEKIGEMIEVTFVNGVMQLSQGYIDVLKLFIVAVKAAYEQGISMADLSSLVEDCPVKSANRDLMPEEIDLRQGWMNIVYLVLQSAGHGTDDVEVGTTVEEGARTKYESLIQTVAFEVTNTKDAAASLGLDDAICIGEAKGLDFSGLNLSNPMEKAITMQCLRVIKAVFTVLEEEKRCHEDGGVGPAPRPPIPGAFKGTN